MADAKVKASAAVSPLAPGTFPDLPVIAGARFAVAQAGVRYKGRTDVMLCALAAGTTVAGVFTRSATRAAPVLDCEAKIGSTAADGAAIVVNSGNANAFTGATGVAAVSRVAEAAARRLGTAAERVFTCSTGVIGEPLPAERIEAVMDELAEALDEASLGEAARAIMTTDTFPKGAAAEVAINGTTVRIAGIAKGSGMIAPDMATMLAYVFTDAAVERSTLQAILSAANDTTFNAISVDGDTSTSDTVLCAATGQSGAPMISEQGSEAGRAFAQALHNVMRDLAHQIVRDGEGATKFVEVAVTGARSDADARKVASAIANSPLVKTAIAGEDPNWGRIVMAVGKSGAEADRDRLSIRFGDSVVAENGWISPSYREEIGAVYMKRSELVIGVDLGLGGGAATMWTCDLTQRYIEINADYRS
ncbi:bifunctional glutamate N-acetyltransferase/amino-acid acetyltransferase ArgJ [Roseitranquillus sediminis]|uniref:bifunctional glutamate N-acetyltransferase/amino-acid acetyltransferase ArgJ n=1 Tax=Roseitranquillus sediminis TaxID=2809051 RepID=UPI001D0C5518|nr:bifunctional glutamate N-acetyltransferase/amino-acid acetyltransferase ArgJ [Roseitranquillus sediminis]MBM9593770.1 bifunctional glutamate N-acetyltransferase/amino-acid acetyltransferase ArgJ [Roseitranquillus sediminis]